MSDKGQSNQHDREIAAELKAEDDEVGEFIPTEHLSAWASEFSPGDLVYFRLRHRAFAHSAKLPELVGFIRVVFGGHELTYLIEVVNDGELPWPDQLVRRRDIVKVFPKES